MNQNHPKSVLDKLDEIKRVDKSNMLRFSVEASQHYRKATVIASEITVGHLEFDEIVIAGMGGSAIGGELLKDYARDMAPTPIEVCRDYSLPAYVDDRSFVVVVSYSGDTEESLSAFLQAVEKGCRVFCISSGGSLFQFAEKLNAPFLRVPGGMPPRAALPYLLVPQLVLLEKLGVVSGVLEGLSEGARVLEKVSRENSPDRPLKANPAKSLALGIHDTSPVIYGFGSFRAVALRWKQQFNENAKVPAKWDVFPELNHNEIVGWEKANSLAECFSTVFLRDKTEPAEVRNRIETSKNLMPLASKQFEVWSEGKSTLAKMLSAILVGDFTSIYLAILRGVDPTPVQTIDTLKRRLSDVGTRERIIGKLGKIKPFHS